jgi:RNA 2',3'-cyclic 3'-phosphodiesterase
MHRLFVGIRPPAFVRDALIDTMDDVPDARWQDDDQLHLTLRYIGEVERPVAEDVAVALGSVHVPPLDLRVEELGCFEHRGRVGTLWAGVAPPEPLAALHRKIDAALVRIGLPPERRAYHPHITLARLKAPASAVRHWLAAEALPQPLPFTATAMLLFESHLRRDGASYEVVARYPLG